MSIGGVAGCGWMWQYGAIQTQNEDFDVCLIPGYAMRLGSEGAWRTQEWKVQSEEQLA